MIFYTRTKPMVISAAAAAGCAFLSVEVEGFQPPLSQTSIATLSRPFLSKILQLLKLDYRKHYKVDEENETWDL